MVRFTRSIILFTTIPFFYFFSSSFFQSFLSPTVCFQLMKRSSLWREQCNVHSWRTFTVCEKGVLISAAGDKTDGVELNASDFVIVSLKVLKNSVTYTIFMITTSEELPLASRGVWEIIAHQCASINILRYTVQLNASHLRKHKHKINVNTMHHEFSLINRSDKGMVLQENNTVRLFLDLKIHHAHSATSCAFTLVLCNTSSPIWLFLSGRQRHHCFMLNMLSEGCERKKKEILI